ncbi:MAG: cysteine desulfurase family protein [Acidobacteriota bacterium]
MNSPVYLDHNATTPLDPRVRDAMLPWLGEIFGNPSSAHAFGQVAREAVERARAAVAELLGGRPAEIVFTGSGTEANNAVIFDLARRSSYKGHIVISALEHPSIREAANRLETMGMAVTRVQPGHDGVIPVAAVEAALRPDTRLVCLMLANNELGTIQPVGEVARLCGKRGIPVLCDAVQAVGKIPVSVTELGIDYLTLGGHKFYGPMGAAALWVRTGSELDGLLVGGPQERHRRASTENVPAIVGLGKASEISTAELPQRCIFLTGLRDRFEDGLRLLPDAVVHCAGAARLPHTTNLALLGAAGDSLLIRLDLRGFAVSTGSACSSGAVEPSKTLLAIGLSESEARSSIRVSFGISNSAEDVDRFLEALSTEAAELRRFGSALIL